MVEVANLTLIEVQKAKRLLAAIAKEVHREDGEIAVRGGLHLTGCGGPQAGEPISEVTLFEANSDSSEPILTIRLEGNRMPRLILHEFGHGLAGAAEAHLADSVYDRETPDGDEIWAIHL